MLPAIRISRLRRARRACSPAGMPGGQRHHDVVLAERVAGVVDPVVHLELDPGGGEHVQRRRRAGTCSRCSSCSADRDRVGLVEQVRPVDRRQVAAEGGADRAHLRGGQVVVACRRSVRHDARLLGGARRHRPRARRRLARLGVDQVVARAGRARSASRLSRPRRTRQPVPGHEPVDAPEARARRGRRARRCAAAASVQPALLGGARRWRRRPPCAPG